MGSLSAPDDRGTAVRVHAARPGVPLQMAYATVQVLRQMGWGPQHESAGPDARKLAAVAALCRDNPHTLTAGDVLRIISSEEGDRG